MCARPVRPGADGRPALTAPAPPIVAPPPRAGEAHPHAKLTEAAVRAWRREAARVVRQRLNTTGGVNARTGAPLTSLLRRTGLFARLAREHDPPVSVAAVCMAVYGATWAEVPGALPHYVPPDGPSTTPTAGGRTDARRRKRARARRGTR